MSDPVEVPAALDGVRVDRAVAFLSGRSRAEVSLLIEAGAVTVGGVVVTQRSRAVRSGERLGFTLDPLAAASGPLRGVAGVAFAVVHADEQLIVIDKPAGLVVHPGAAHREDTLAAGLLHRFPDLAAAAAAGAGEADRPGIVHRLDKDTSGLLVVARTPEAYRSLVAQLAARTMHRRYLALALGRVEAEEGLVEAPIGRSRRQPTKMAVTVDGREARTRYRVLERFSEPEPATYLQLELETGRTHQIRVHLSAIGHPVAGDPRYGGGRRGFGALRRPFLHAAELELTHPGTGEQARFTSPLAPELEAVLAGLRRAAE
ncbi:MAG TPA: RluA family pseudouridine synthase [Acidimicrobiales bacterium]|nr:RluA family pseudouridine synthase [Acidimicrobiales bacterium]